MIFGPYKGVVEKVHDGDTVDIRIEIDHDEGFDLHILARIYARVRVFGINAPELSTIAGRASRDFAMTVLPVGTKVEIVSHGWDKYGGRIDGEITLLDGTDFSNLMVSTGFAAAVKY